MPNPATLHTILLLIAATALLVAAIYDLAVRIVPNALSSVVALAGLTLNTLDQQLAATLFGASLVFAGAWQCWRRGWIGGGDVKLLGACALLVPPAMVPELVLGTALSGGIMALLYLGLARLLPTADSTASRPAGWFARLWRAEHRRISGRLSLPYACAIVAGVALTLCAPIPFG